MICPVCNSVFSQEELFCLNDGNRLVAEDGEQETVVNRPIPPYQAGPVNPGMADAAGPGQFYGAGSFVPPASATRPPRSAVQGVLIGGLSMLVVILLIVCVLLIVWPKGPVIETNVPIANPQPTTPVKVDPTPSKKKDPVNTNSSTGSDDDLAANFHREYQGSSFAPGHTLRLNLSLDRNGDSLTGSAETPDDLDDLSGTISSDGSFTLDGYNHRAGRVTGVWRGQIKNGSISGIWTATNGHQVSFSASLR